VGGESSNGMRKRVHDRSIYIAGPMRGYPRYNFDAFHNAEKVLELDWNVLNPARVDEEDGFDPDHDVVTPDMMEKFILRDLDMVLRVNAIAVLPGWEKSTGANAEVALAKWRGIPVYLFPRMVAMHEEDILEEALRITRGDRQNQYGPPDQDFQRTAKMWSALKGVEFTAHEVALFMIALKLSRQTHQDKRDNWVDIAGYARCGSVIKP
jgi:hypothetical protein